MKKIYPPTIDEVLATLDPATEYIGEDGLIHCKFCHDAKMFVDIEKNYAQRRPCDCISEKNKRELEEEERAKAIREERELKRSRRIGSLLIGEYESATFEGIDLEGADESVVEVFKRLQKYCKNAEAILDRGLGFYLYGKTGVGKTYLMACVANKLLESGYKVLFTNMRNIKSDIQRCYDSGRDERDVEQRYIDVDFLFIDDIGAERLVDANGKPYAIQSNLYNIINGRLLAHKPTNYTSNMSIRQLVSMFGMEQRTADRINLMSSMVKEIKGENYRKRIVQNREDLF